MRNYFFEENIPGPVGYGRWTRPRASMDVDGEIQISPMAWDLMDRPDFVVVGFDRASMTIMIRPAANKTERNRQPLVKKYRGRRVRARSLLEQFGLEVVETLRFTEVKVDDRCRLILPLGSAVPYYTGGRVGAFHKERKKKLERQRPVWRKVAELAVGKFEEVETEEQGWLDAERAASGGLGVGDERTTPSVGAAAAGSDIHPSFVRRGAGADDVRWGEREFETRRRQTVEALEESKAIEARPRAAKRKSPSHLLREVQALRRQWERDQRARGLDPYPEGTPVPDDRELVRLLTGN
jgi:hypothetical protein